MGAAPHIPMALNLSLGAFLLVLTLLQAPGGQALVVVKMVPLTFLLILLTCLILALIDHGRAA